MNSKRIKSKTTAINAAGMLAMLICAAACMFPALGAVQTRIALMELERHDVTDLEISVVAHFLRSSFVNTGIYTVLDRENTDKILAEQSLQNYGIVSEAEAIQMGRLLNVEQIAVGTLMKLQGEYFLEVRMIDVQTSSITASRTDRCSGNQELPAMAQRIVERLSGTEIAAGTELPVHVDTVRADTADLDFYDQTEIAHSGSSEVEKEKRRMRQWRMIGFSSHDYDRFKEAGKDEPSWASDDRRSVALAAALGPLTATSGFFYTRNYGTAFLITFAKAIGAVGMIQTYQKGGEDSDKFRIYAGVLSAATIADAFGSAYSARSYNAKLEKLTALHSLSLDINSQKINATYTHKF